MTYDPLANRVAERRRELGFSQQRLADAAGIHKNTVGLIELGKMVPAVSIAQAIALALSTTVDDLFPPVEKAS